MNKNQLLWGRAVGASATAKSGGRCWCILAVVAAAALLLVAPTSALAQHTFGVNFTKSCPLTAQPGDMVTCTLRIENEDVDHSVSIDSLTDEAPTGSAPVAVASCPTPFVLTASDGMAGMGTDFVACDVIFTIPAGYAEATFEDQAEVMFHDVGIIELMDTNQASGTIFIQYACCLMDGTCVAATESECTAQGGTFQGLGTNCTTLQGCCLADGTCVNVDPLCCDELGGTVQATLCTTPQGCCLSNNTCVNVDPICCDDLGGVVQTGSCTTPQGCCLSNGTCVNVDPICCDDLGGTVQTGQCTTPQGCCFSDGTCVNTDPLCCTAAGGTPQTGSCGGTQACCLTDNSCLDMDALCCAARGGTPKGTGTTCATVTCVGLEGCTPGYWKQEHHFGNWTTPYDPSDPFDDHFEDAFPGLTLLEVLQQGGGGLKALGRHTVAALLNAASPGVDYPLSPAQVIAAFDAVFPGSNVQYEDLKDDFEDFNELGCPLGRAELLDSSLSSASNEQPANSGDGNDEPSAGVTGSGLCGWFTAPLMSATIVGMGIMTWRRRRQRRASRRFD